MHFKTKHQLRKRSSDIMHSLFQLYSSPFTHPPSGSVRFFDTVDMHAHACAETAGRRPLAGQPGILPTNDSEYGLQIDTFPKRWHLWPHNFSSI